MGSERNARCPCGSGRKFKHCCLEQRAPSDRPVGHSSVQPKAALPVGPPPSLTRVSSQLKSKWSSASITVRERNYAFLNELGDALQLTSLESRTWAQVKRGITSRAVRQINEAILRIWPPDLDFEALLQQRTHNQVGFFSGEYRPELLLNALGRHLIYADKVALADPFQYPLAFIDEYSPLLHPEKHRTTTAKCVMVWFRLAELMEDGLVEMIRLPGDFDMRLRRANIVASEALAKRHAEIMDAVNRHVRFRVDVDNDENQEWLMLLHPDARLAEIQREAMPNVTQEDIDRFLAYVHRRRDEHPFYLDGVHNELVAETSGASVYDAVQVASLSGGYLLTDLEARWRQIDCLRRESADFVDPRVRVAHGLQNISLPMAQHLDLSLARRIREEGQLSRVRGLLDRLMRQAGGEAPLSDSDARSFEQEFVDAVEEAKDEYTKIDRDLMKWSGGEAVGVAGFYGLAGGSLSVSLASLAAAGAINLAASFWGRKRFKARYPAAMFLDVPTR